MDEHITTLECRAVQLDIEEPANNLSDTIDLCIESNVGDGELNMDSIECDSSGVRDKLTVNEPCN
jgi:hypothetical protein